MDADELALTELRDITLFAQRQSTLLKTMYELKTDADFAQLCMIKLQEEAGEVAEAFLSYRRMQRANKLQRTDGELRTDLGRELADVTVVIALLAKAIGLSFDQILADRIRELDRRRDGMISVINQRLADIWEKSSNWGDQLELPLPGSDA